MKQILFITLMICATLTGQAQQVDIDGIMYVLNKDTHEAMIGNGSSCTGELAIPAEVNCEGGNYTVTSISGMAFNGCKLTKVIIPSTIKEIHYYKDRFGKVYYNPFIGCADLAAIEVDKDNQWMCSVDGVLFNKAKTELYSYPAGVRNDTYTVPEGVEKIGGEAFSFNTNLMSVTLPNTVTQLGYAAFEGCSNLEQVELSNSLKLICSASFLFCNSLKTIDLPASITVIEENVFGFSGLESIVIPEGIKELGDCLFISCTSLKSVVLPSTVAEISAGMFMNCSSLEKVIITEKTSRVSAQAFGGCSSLKVIELPQSVSYLGSFAFKNCKLKVLAIRGNIDTKCLNESTFQGLDTSSTIYVQSSEVDKFKDIFAGSILPLKDYNPADISPVTLQPAADAPLYDLQGRRLMTKPQRGVYVQGGRKYVVK